MKLLRITSIQRGCVFDGPGVRTTLFLKGCTLQCPWCCNPETISSAEQYFIDDDKCLFRKGINSAFCELCERIDGSRSILLCPFGVVEKVSKDYYTADLIKILLKDISLFKGTNGGITFSGGEPLLQADALIPLLKRLKERDVHIAFETTLTVPERLLLLILPYSDLFIVDLKLQPQMYLYKDEYLSLVKKMISLLSGKQILYRMVFVNQMNSVRYSVLSRLSFLKIESVELLLCHNLGKRKYQKLLKKDVDFSASKSEAEQFAFFLKENDIDSMIYKV